jgi:hypothetical protein
MVTLTGQESPYTREPFKVLVSPVAPSLGVTYKALIWLTVLLVALPYLVAIFLVLLSSKLSSQVSSWAIAQDKSQPRSQALSNGSSQTE